MYIKNPEPVLNRDMFKDSNVEQYLAFINDYPYIDWMRAIQNADTFFRHFYWPQKIGLVFVSNFPLFNRKNDLKQLSKILSTVCFKGRLNIKLKEGDRGTCAYVHYEDQFEGQLAVLLLNGFIFRGYELKVLPCINLFTEKLPDAIFKPAFNINLLQTMTFKDMRRVAGIFLSLWKAYNLQVKHRPDLGSTPIISDVVMCQEAVKQIKCHRARKIAVDCEGVSLGREDGKLCLVQIATPQMVYLFDILTGGEKLFSEGGLRDLLQDTGILKITHDCRSDSLALFKEYNVKLERVFDTQLTYAVLNTQQGGPIPIPVSLSTLFAKYGDGQCAKLKEVVKEEMIRDDQFWTQRPMTENMIKYAQQDVMHLFIIYRNMKKLLNPSSRAVVSARSAVYSRAYLHTPVKHECTPRAQSVPLYHLDDWDRTLLMQLFGKICTCLRSSACTPCPAAQA